MRNTGLLLTAGLMSIGLSLAFPGAAPAQDYPSKPIRIIVPLPPGGTADLLARLLAEHFTAAFRQPTVTENRPGGNTMPATLATARSTPDGHTLLIGAPSAATFKVFFKNPPVDTERDLSAVSLLMVSPYILAINAALPANTLGEFVAYAKANAGKLQFGGYGGQFLATESFKRAAGIDMFYIGYKGDAQAVQALLTNDIQFLLSVPLTLKPHVDAGKLRALASSITGMRSPGMPNVPTSAEAGLPGFDVSISFGLLAPGGTPIEIRRKLAGEIARFVAKPDVISKFQLAGFQPQSNTPEEYAKFLSSEIRRWTEIAKNLPIEAE